MTDITCPSCNGAKKLLSLGLQYADCWNCSGKGFVAKEEEIVKVEEIHTFTKNDLVVLKKRGRPKRAVNA